MHSAFSLTLVSAVSSLAQTVPVNLTSLLPTLIQKQGIPQLKVFKFNPRPSQTTKNARHFGDIQPQFNVSSKDFTSLSSIPTDNYTDTTILLVYTPADRAIPVSNVSNEYGNMKGNGSDILVLFQWMNRPRFISDIPVRVDTFADKFTYANGYAPLFSRLDDCTSLYNCVFYAWLGINDLPSLDFGADSSRVIGENSETVFNCIGQLYQRTPAIYCPLRLLHVNPIRGCSYHDGDLNREAWIGNNVDFELDRMQYAGPDAGGIWWPRLQNTYNSTTTAYFPNETLPFTTTLGRQFLGDPTFQCSIENRCSVGLDCQRVGSRTAFGPGGDLYPEVWPYQVLVSLENISNQLSNQYAAIRGATISATLAAFEIQHYYPKTLPGYNVLNSLQSLALTFALLAGFAPGFTEVGLSASSAAIGAVGGYLGRYLPNNTMIATTQERYTEIVEEIYSSLKTGLDNLSEPLFNGEPIYGNYSISSMMKGGAWVDHKSLQPIANIEEQFRIEIISRSINELWKTPPFNKTFVLFVDLDEEVNSTAHCDADSTGPQSLKYCRDGGVYYPYNFIEDGQGQGHLSWPHGAQQLLNETKIDPKWITEASAKTYQFAKAKSSFNPFNFSIANATDSFIEQLFQQKPAFDFRNFAGRSPGSWTLPVCNASWWGAKWNINYEGEPGPGVKKFPCFCGYKGNETQDWANAAGMYNFETFYDTCKTQLTDVIYSKFAWPDNVTSVDLGHGVIIQKPKY